MTLQLSTTTSFLLFFCCSKKKFREFNLFAYSFLMYFIFVTIVDNHFNFAKFSNCLLALIMGGLHSKILSYDCYLVASCQHCTVQAQSFCISLFGICFRSVNYQHQYAKRKQASGSYIFQISPNFLGKSNFQMKPNTATTFISRSPIQSEKQLRQLQRIVQGFEYSKCMCTLYHFNNKLCR